MSETQPKTGPWRLRFTAVLVMGGLGVLAGTLAGLAGPFWWVADLASHFAVYYAVAAAGLLVLALLLRQWVWSGVTLFVLILNCILIWPSFVPVTTRVPPGSSLLTLALVNIEHMNRNESAVGNYLQACNADLIFIQETDPWWDRTLRGMDLPYLIAESQPREGAFGMSLLVHESLAEGDTVVLEQTRVTDLAGGFSGAERPAIQATLSLNGHTVRILSIHPPPPVSRRNTALRDSVLRQARHWSDEQTDPHVIIGDLNTTPWSYAFRLLTSDDQLVSTHVGRGNQGTWPTRYPMPWYLPIDHCLHSRDWVCVDRQIGDYTGSDHWPVRVTLALPPESVSPPAANPSKTP